MRKTTTNINPFNLILPFGTGWLSGLLVVLLFCGVVSAGAGAKMTAPINHEILFVDTDVQDYQTLVHGVRPGIEVVVLNGQCSAMVQIATVLQSRRGLDIIHVLSHGRPGCVQLGTEVLSLADLNKYAPEITAIKKSLAPGGRIELYGCEVARGSEGRKFIQALGTATHAIISASSDFTGSSALGGNWDLEVTTGSSSAPIAFNHESTAAFSGLLPATDTGVNATYSVYVRPGGTSGYWSFGSDYTPDGNYPGLHTITSIKYYEAAAPINWFLTRGHYQYSSNGGSTWNTFTMDQNFANYTTVAGTIWRFVDTLPADTTTANTVGISWYLQGVPSSVQSGMSIVPDNAPTDVFAKNYDIWPSPAVGDAIAALGNVDTGLATGGIYAIDSQSVPNLFTISSNVLYRGTGTVPAVGQTPTVTVRYYDHLQLDINNNPVSGQGIAKTLTFTVRTNPPGFGNDIHVNTFTANAQITPVITKLSNGNFVTVWRSAGQDGKSTSLGGIYGQISTAAGAKVGNEFAITPTDTVTNEIAPSVTALDNGRFVVSYTKVISSTDNDIIFRIVEANGTLGSEINAATSAIGNQSASVEATLTNGSFVVAWVSTNTSDAADIFARCFNSANGSAVSGSQLTVNTTTTGSQSLPAVAALNNGNYVVTWRDPANNGDIRARVLSAAGVVSSEIAVATSTNSQTTPRVAGLTGGGFVITWQENAHTEGSVSDSAAQSNIYAQRYDNSGAAQGSVFLVNAGTTGNQIGPSASSLSGGGFVVVWQSDTDADGSTGIFGRRFNAAGTPVDSYDFQVNQVRANAQITPMVAGLASDSFASAWNDSAIDGAANSGIQERVFTATVSAPEIGVSGNGTDIVDGDAVPAVIDFTDFGSTNITSGSVSHSFMITNSGNATLHLGSVTLTGANAADFTITSQPATMVGANQSTTFTVQFIPGGTGVRTASLSFTNDDINENPFDFQIQGTGVLQTTATSLGASVNPAAYGANITFTATVTPGSSTGSVTFKDGAATLGTGTLSGGIATYATTSLSVGVHNITAVYAGNAVSAVSTSSILVQTVNKAPATIILGNLSPTYDGTAKNVSVGTTPVNLTVNLTYNGSPNVPTNAGSYVVIGMINDLNYSGGVTNTLVIAQASQTIAFGPLSYTVYGDAPFTLTGTAGSGLTVSYASSVPSIATVSNNTVYVFNTGSTTLTASQSGNLNYLAATNVSQTLVVSPLLLELGIIPGPLTNNVRSTAGLSVTGNTNRLYVIQYIQDLTQTNWSVLANTNLSASPITITVPTDQSYRFYRLQRNIWTP